MTAPVAPMEARHSVTPLEALKRLIEAVKTTAGMRIDYEEDRDRLETELAVAEMVVRDYVEPLAAQPAGDVALAQAIAYGYEGGSLITDPTQLGATIKLYYESEAEAEMAFEAIVKSVDSAIAQGRKA